MKQIKYLSYIVLINLIFSQGNFQILKIPSNTRLLALSNSGQALNNFVNSYNPASIKVTNKNFNIHSHIYPLGIFYTKSEVIIPKNKSIYSFEYSNLNYGKFKDANINYTFNCSEFLFKSSMKTEILDKFSLGASLGYTINKISTEFSHALFISLGARAQMDNPKLGLGFSINNIGKIIKNFGDTKEALPISINFSTFYQPKYFPGILCMDFYQEKNLQIRSGVEFKVNNNLSLRLGNSTNTLKLIDSYSSYFSGLSMGAGIQVKNWDIDLGFYNLETAGIISGISLVYKKYN